MRRTSNRGQLHTVAIIARSFVPFKQPLFSAHTNCNGVQGDTDDFADLESYILHTPAAPSLDAMRPLFPRWRRYLRSQGVERVTLLDTNASNIMIQLIMEAIPERNGAKEHMQRNLIALTNRKGTMRPYKP